MTLKLTPLGDRIIVERLEAESKTKGGIILPDTAKEKPSEGKVVAVGKGALNDKGEIIPMHIKVGQIILFAKWGGTEIKIEGKDYIIMKESDVLAIKETN
jgi:chaperonin GroES